MCVDHIYCSPFQFTTILQFGSTWLCPSPSPKPDPEQSSSIIFKIVVKIIVDLCAFYVLQYLDRLW